MNVFLTTNIRRKYLQKNRRKRKRELPKPGIEPGTSRSSV